MTKSVEIGENGEIITRLDYGDEGVTTVVLCNPELLEENKEAVRATARQILLDRRLLERSPA